MKKILYVLFAVMAASLILVSCAKDGADRVKSDTCDFSFEMPEGGEWKQTYSDGMLSISKANDVSKATISAFSFEHGLADPAVLTSSDYWTNHYLPQLSDTFGKIDNVKLGEITLSGSKHAHAVYTVALGDEQFDCETILILYGNKVYTLSLTQGTETEENKEYYKDCSDEFRKLAGTFTIN